MTYGMVIASAHVLQKLVTQPLPLKKAYQLTKIVKLINNELDFFGQKQQSINASDCSDEEKEQQMNELLNFEVDLDFEPLELTMDDNIQLSCSDIDMAEGVIKILE